MRVCSRKAPRQGPDKIEGPGSSRERETATGSESILMVAKIVGQQKVQVGRNMSRREGIGTKCPLCKCLGRGARSGSFGKQGQRQTKARQNGVGWIAVSSTNREPDADWSQTKTNDGVGGRERCKSAVEISRSS